MRGSSRGGDGSGNRSKRACDYSRPKDPSDGHPRLLTSTKNTLTSSTDHLGLFCELTGLLLLTVPWLRLSPTASGPNSVLFLSLQPTSPPPSFSSDSQIRLVRTSVYLQRWRETASLDISRTTHSSKLVPYAPTSPAHFPFSEVKLASTPDGARRCSSLVRDLPR